MVARGILTSFHNASNLRDFFFWGVGGEQYTQYGVPIIQSNPYFQPFEGRLQSFLCPCIDRSEGYNFCPVFLFLSVCPLIVCLLLQTALDPLGFLVGVSLGKTLQSPA